MRGRLSSPLPRRSRLCYFLFFGDAAAKEDTDVEVFSSALFFESVGLTPACCENLCFSQCFVHAALHELFNVGFVFEAILCNDM